MTYPDTEAIFNGLSLAAVAVKDIIGINNLKHAWQIFLDGNKRTAMLAGNAEMLSSGCGIISVSIEKRGDFAMLLINYHESGDMAEIKDFFMRAVSMG